MRCIENEKQAIEERQTFEIENKILIKQNNELSQFKTEAETTLCFNST